MIQLSEEEIGNMVDGCITKVKGGKMVDMSTFARAVEAALRKKQAEYIRKQWRLENHWVIKSLGLEDK